MCHIRQAGHTGWDLGPGTWQAWRPSLWTEVFSKAGVGPGWAGEPKVTFTRAEGGTTQLVSSPRVSFTVLICPWGLTCRHFYSLDSLW
jgi:hypothetical protein